MLPPPSQARCYISRINEATPLPLTLWWGRNLAPRPSPCVRPCSNSGFRPCGSMRR